MSECSKLARIVSEIRERINGRHRKEDRPQGLRAAAGGSPGAVPMAGSGPGAGAGAGACTCLICQGWPVSPGLRAAPLTRVRAVPPAAAAAGLDSILSRGLMQSMPPPPPKYAPPAPFSLRDVMAYIRNTYTPQVRRYQVQMALYQQQLPSLVPAPNYQAQSMRGNSFSFAIWDETLDFTSSQEGWKMVMEGGSTLPFPPSGGPGWGGWGAPPVQAAASSGPGRQPCPACRYVTCRCSRTFSSKGMPGFDGGGRVPEMIMPDVMGSAQGYRWWTLAAPDLSKDPTTADKHWPRIPLKGMRDVWEDGENVAKCLNGQRLHDDADIPHPDCSCVTPETRVLTADLNWVPAGDLTIGERLFAFDERQSRRGWGENGGRKYRSAVVANTDRAILPCYDLEFSDGTKVRVSSDHKWLCYTGQKGAHWVRTDELRAGEQRASWVVKPFAPWEPDESREAGYLAAAFDGEGCLFQKVKPYYQFRLDFAQVDNPMLAETERCLKELGFAFTHRVRPRGAVRGYGLLRADGTPRPDGHLLEITSRPELLRFLGSVRPARLLPKFQPDSLGRLNMQSRVRLVRKTFAGAHEVVKLGTTSGTYFAEGLASHNCGFWAYWTLQVHEVGYGQLPVCGVVEGSGAVEIGTRGFRAAKAKIVALHLPFTIQPAGEPDEDPLGLGLPSPQAMARSQAQPNGPAYTPGRGGTVYHRGNPWYNHPLFHGRVYDSRDHEDPPPPPVPELSKPDAAERQSNRDRAEAWLAVIGDRLSVMYPSATVFETKAAMEAVYPPDLSYTQEEGGTR